eukprot:6186550-Pleurochrysis_carterae.AAC.3
MALRRAPLPCGAARSGAARFQNGPGGLPLSASDAHSIWSYARIDGLSLGRPSAFKGVVLDSRTSLAALFDPGLVRTGLVLIVRFTGPQAEFATGYHIDTTSSKVQALRLLHSYMLSRGSEMPPCLV